MKRGKAIDYSNIIEGYSPLELFEAVEEGLPVKVYVSIQKKTGLSLTEMAMILGVSISYLKSKKRSDLLNTMASERLVKYYELWTYGFEVFDKNEENFKAWLETPLAQLNSKTPLEMMKNLIGMEMVKEMLGRIEYGVYS